MADAAALDRRATGADRGALIAALWAEQPGCGIARAGETLGFHLARPGSNAVQIGPCIAAPAVGAEILQDALRRQTRQSVFLDIPAPNQIANEIARAADLAPQRTLLRMTRGRKTAERLDMLWASSGPEKG
jgi:hypothetical protein